MASPKKLAAEAHNQDDLLLAGSPEGLARAILESATRDDSGKRADLAGLWEALNPASRLGATPPVAGDSAPLLSICIPTYQRPEYLFAVLLSLAAEFAAAPDLGGRVEVIVVDNASGDLTAGVVEIARAGIPQLAYHQNEFNLGPDPNFFKALGLARGEYEWLLGDDELVLPGGLARIVDELVRHAPAHLFLNFRMLSIQRELIAADFLVRLDRQPHSLLELLKKIGFVRGFALISAHVFRTAVFREHCEPDLTEALSYYPIVPVILKAFAADPSCRQLFEITIAHRVNNRFPDVMAVNHTRVLGVLRVLNLLMVKYRVLAPADVSEIFEYAAEGHTGWYLVDELEGNCRRLLKQDYSLPVGEMDTIQSFFELTKGPQAKRFLRKLRKARFIRDKPVMARAAIAAKSARFSALFLVEAGADLRSLPTLLPSDPRFHYAVDLVCLMVGWPLAPEVIALFDQVIAVPGHVYPHCSELVNLLALQARCDRMLVLLVRDEASARRAAERLRQAYESSVDASEDRLHLAQPVAQASSLHPPKIDVKQDCLHFSQRPPVGSWLETAVHRAIAHSLEPPVPPPEVEAISLARSRFMGFRGCDLRLYDNSSSIALLDLAYRSRHAVAWEAAGGEHWPEVPAGGGRGGIAVGLVHWVRRWRKFPIHESERVRQRRLNPPRWRNSGAAGPPARGPAGSVWRELLGFLVQWRRAIRSAWRVSVKEIGKWFR